MREPNERFKSLEIENISRTVYGTAKCFQFSMPSIPAAQFSSVLHYAFGRCERIDLHIHKHFFCLETFVCFVHCAVVPNLKKLTRN